MAIMYYYAELDENDVCIGMFESYSKIEGDPMLVEIDSLDETLFGLRYDRETGEWEEPGFIPAHSTNDISYRYTDKVLSDVLDEKVTSVNNVKPDENGNVNINTSTSQQFTVKVLGNSSI